MRGGYWLTGQRADEAAQTCTEINGHPVNTRWSFECLKYSVLQEKPSFRRLRAFPV